MWTPSSPSFIWEPLIVGNQICTQVVWGWTTDSLIISGISDLAEEWFESRVSKLEIFGMEVICCWDFLEPSSLPRATPRRRYRCLKHLSSWEPAVLQSEYLPTVEEIGGRANNTSMSNANADLKRKWLLSKHVTLLNPAAFWCKEMSLIIFMSAFFIVMKRVAISCWLCQFRLQHLTHIDEFLKLFNKVWNYLVTINNNNKHFTITFFKRSFLLFSKENGFLLSIVLLYMLI